MIFPLALITNPPPPSQPSTHNLTCSGSPEGGRHDYKNLADDGDEESDPSHCGYASEVAEDEPEGVERRDTERRSPDAGLDVGVEVNVPAWKKICKVSFSFFFHSPLTLEQF